MPEDLTCSPMFDLPRHGGPLYRLSFWNLISAHIAGFSAGVGRRALDEFVMAAEAKHRRASPTSVADDPVVQHRFAVVDGDLQAARAFFIEAIGEAWQTVTRGDPYSLRQRARVMSATRFCNAPPSMKYCRSLARTSQTLPEKFENDRTLAHWCPAETQIRCHIPASGQFQIKPPRFRRSAYLF